MSEALHMWTVYDHPRDYPDKYVARRSEIGAASVKMTNDMFVADTVDELRTLLPPGLVCLSRDPNDDPCIVEVWL
jgi:hypothetical protein